MDYFAGEQAWQIVRAHLEKHLSPHAWNTWIRPLIAIGILHGVLYVRIPDAAFANLRKKHAKFIEQALAGQASDLVLMTKENLATYFEKSANQPSIQVQEATA